MRPIAVVTGASSGIGAALADALAADGFDLVLVARDGARLDVTAARCRERGADARTLLADLSDASKTAAVAAELSSLPVAFLANNAGFGVHGPFQEVPLDRELALVRLQIDAALALTKAVLAGMVARRSGRVLNVGSVYSFSPVPEQAVYAATKAFLRSFTETLAAELKGTGVTVTGVYPGVTQSEFRSRAGIRSRKAGAGATAESVAKAALAAAREGKLECVPGGANRLFVEVMRGLPGAAAAALMRRINRARGLSPA